ncbi:serine/threonine protein kinase [Streptomyces sp. CB03234]|uniref:serine/threonine-protein kinase n=1 Tax=Streptomyces sp. (strain CB03234) TaxID=1703937 RepID=UPI00093D7D33|nr:serine/threonine-protein kinase [Streptomyces sp. CB03234]OKK08415.1 serine/threonine protein kinase [Streptomyces sp. CB03234]
MDPHRNAPGLGLPEGYRIADWAVTALLGSGSWGTVYAAERAGGTAPGPGVAVKLLRTDLLSPGQRASMEELIRQEVRFSSEAKHPNLVRTHDVVTLRDPDRPDLDGVTALVMDRAERSLHDLITAGEQGAPVPGAERILCGVAAGLAHMHARGWVHADLKPANILLGPDDAVRLADFGLTVELDGTHAYIPPLGSLDHVPPEWWSERTGIRGTTVRQTADIWAFGVLAHQVLTGGLHPFPGGTARARALAAQAYAGGSAQLRLDDALRPEWRELIGACLAPDHASRAALGAEELARRVRDLHEGARTRPRLRRTALLLGTGLGLAAVTAATLTLLPDGTSDGKGAAPSAKPAARTSPASGPPGAIPADSDVPVALRATITDAAKRCTDPEVTPAFLAAMLKAESGFDPRASRPSAGEYGIAMWTPSVFQAWAVDGDGDGDKDHMSPPDAIATMAVFVCWLDQRFKDNGLHDNLHALMAAGYRTSDKTVIEARGVPERTRPHVDKVLRYLEEYTR